MAVEIVKHRWTLAEYRSIGAAAIWPEDLRVELIGGEVVDMAPVGSKHAGCVSRLDRAFQQAGGASVLVFVQNPIELGPTSEPQPDVAVLRPRSDDYTTALPTAADVLLLIEIADSSLEYDRRIKGPLYAAAGIPEYWIANLPADVLEVYRDPAPGGYRTVATLRAGASVTPAALPQITLQVAALLA